jgi:hypothetical protein
MNENNMNQADRFNDDKSTAYDELIKKIIPLVTRSVMNLLNICSKILCKARQKH